MVSMLCADVLDLWTKFTKLVHLCVIIFHVSLSLTGSMTTRVHILYWTTICILRLFQTSSRSRSLTILLNSSLWNVSIMIFMHVHLSLLRLLHVCSGVISTVLNMLLTEEVFVLVGALNLHLPSLGIIWILGCWVCQMIFGVQAHAISMRC